MNYKYPHPIRNKKRKSKKLLFFLLTIIFVVYIFSYYKYKDLIYKPVDINNNTDISFSVKQGETAKDIAKDLEEKELIKNSSAFYFYTKFNNLGETILAGRFMLNQSMNVPELIEALSNPYSVEKIVTIQEGLTVKDIDAKLTEMELIKSGNFINEVKNFTGWEYYPFLEKEKLQQLNIPLEGFLYPDTYYIDANEFKTHDLIYLALDNFENKIATVNLENKDLNQIITMASIIEKEVFGAEDRRIVSGILWKRYESGWPLGADATILYYTNDNEITYQELQEDSPYNTRKNKGLPPGPISNPSLESIEAAANPKDSPYWFYLNTPDTGETIYSKTNEEHNINKNKYL